MKSTLLFAIGATILFSSLTSTTVGAEELRTISLPPAQTDGGKLLMEALRQRHTTREFKPEPLPPQTLANLLWAAFGINRPLTGQRTAPSAMNSQEVEVYAAMPEGLFRYESKAHQLREVLAEDVRPRAGGQDSFRQASGDSHLRCRSAPPGESKARNTPVLCRIRCRLHLSECLSILRLRRIGNRGARFGSGPLSSGNEAHA